MFSSIKSFLQVALLTVSALFSAAALSAPAKVVYHVDFNDVTRYSATLTSIANIITAYEAELRDYEVTLVFVGHGIRFVTDDVLKGTPYATNADLDKRRAELKGRLETLVKVRGVKALLCDKTRDEIALDKSKVYSMVGLTPSGVATIADLQMQGAAYLKIQ
ncbi:MAG: DsrE family protein [Gammaproteobacteria bacterium]|nr:DsrE family protein [Gammaproteobacteria bacterium]